MLLFGPQVVERTAGCLRPDAIARPHAGANSAAAASAPERHAVRGRCSGYFRLLTDAPAGVCWRLHAASVAAGSLFRAAPGCRSYPGRRCCGAADGRFALSGDFKVQSLAASPAMLRGLQAARLQTDSFGGLARRGGLLQSSGAACTLAQAHLKTSAFRLLLQRDGDPCDAMKAKLQPRKVYEECDKWHGAKYTFAGAADMRKMPAGVCDAHALDLMQFSLLQVFIPAGLGFSDVSSI